MFTHNGTTPSPTDNRHVEAQLEALKEGLRKLVDQLAATSEPPSRLRSFGSRVTRLVRAYPIAAAGVALGLGYTFARIVRR